MQGDLCLKILFNNLIRFHLFHLGRKDPNAGESGPAVMRFTSRIRGINRMKIYVTSWFNGSNLALISIIYGNGFPIITLLSSLGLLSIRWFSSRAV